MVRLYPCCLSRWLLQAISACSPQRLALFVLTARALADSSPRAGGKRITGPRRRHDCTSVRLSSSFSLWADSKESRLHFSPFVFVLLIVGRQQRVTTALQSVCLRPSHCGQTAKSHDCTSVPLSSSFSLWADSKESRLHFSPFVFVLLIVGRQQRVTTALQSLCLRPSHCGQTAKSHDCTSVPLSSSFSLWADSKESRLHFSPFVFVLLIVGRQQRVTTALQSLCLRPSHCGQTAKSHDCTSVPLSSSFSLWADSKESRLHFSPFVFVLLIVGRQQRVTTALQSLCLRPSHCGQTAKSHDCTSVPLSSSFSLWADSKECDRLKTPRPTLRSLSIVGAR